MYTYIYIYIYIHIYVYIHIYTYIYTPPCSLHSMPATPPRKAALVATDTGRGVKEKQENIVR